MTDKPKRTRGAGMLYLRPGSDVYQMKYYVNGVPRRESTKTNNKREAERKLQQRLAEVRTGKLTGSKVERMMVSELADDLLRDYRINGKKSLDWAERRWNLHLKPVFGCLKALDVTRERIDRYVDDRLKQGASNASVNRELAALKRMFNLGQAREKVNRVPTFPHLREDNIRTGFVEDWEYDKLAAACAKEGLWMRSLFETGYRIGWRISELLHLQVRQVDLLNRTVRLLPGQTKNLEGRTAPINDSLYFWLQQCLIEKLPEEYVFTRDNLHPVRDFRGTWAKVTEAAGCPGLLFHDLRRSAVRNMVRDGIPERVAMTISGHLTRSVFDRYNIVSETDLKDAGRKMGTRQAQGTLDTSVHTSGHTGEIKATVPQPSITVTH